MNSLNLTLIVLPESLWKSWPTDRNIAALADDAEALRRRAWKGVGVGVQRSLFLQLARRIDALAIESLAQGGVRSVTFSGSEVDLCLTVQQALLAEKSENDVPMKVEIEPVPVRSASFWQSIREFLNRIFGRKKSPDPKVNSSMPPRIGNPWGGSLPRGKHIFLPGAELNYLIALFLQTNGDALSAKLGLESPDSQKELTETLIRLQTFFRSIDSKSGLIEVLS